MIRVKAGGCLKQPSSYEVSSDQDRSVYSNTRRRVKNVPSCHALSPPHTRPMTARSACQIGGFENIQQSRKVWSDGFQVLGLALCMKQTDSVSASSHKGGRISM